MVNPFTTLINFPSFNKDEKKSISEFFNNDLA